MRGHTESVVAAVESVPKGVFVMLGSGRPEPLVLVIIVEITNIIVLDIMVEVDRTPESQDIKSDKVYLQVVTLTPLQPSPHVPFGDRLHLDSRKIPGEMDQETFICQQLG